MADGDASAGTAASAIGLAVMTGLEKVKDVWRFMNSTRDMIANHITGGTHPASAINSGTLAAARIPSLDASVIATGNLASARLPASIPAGLITTGNLLLAGIVRGTQVITTSDFDATGTANLQGAPSTALGGFTQVVVRNSDGKIGIAVSSRRFKQDITPAERRRKAIMAIRIVNYRLRAEVKEFGDEAPVYIGVIAEELHELGLAEYVVYRDGKPFTVHYDQLVCDLILTVQEDDERLTRLEQKVGI